MIKSTVMYVQGWQGQKGSVVKRSTGGLWVDLPCVQMKQATFVYWWPKLKNKGTPSLFSVGHQRKGFARDRVWLSEKSSWLWGPSSRHVFAGTVPPEQWNQYVSEAFTLEAGKILCVLKGNPLKLTDGRGLLLTIFWLVIVRAQLGGLKSWS